jgi:protoheme IX farnesyltransferase
VSAPEVRVVDPRAVPSGRRRLGAYIELTKPRIIELLLVTTVPAMIVAARGWPDTWLVVATLVGGALSAGGANAINNVVDRDIDEVMHRTRGRPLPSARIEPSAALAFGISLGVAGFAWLWATANLPAAALSTGGLLFYVVVYTLGLKRTSPQNIVIGGAAGSVPALVGWAAVTGSLAAPAWVMFAIVFFWTPPHFWALALRYKDDYAAAGVPMLPVVAGTPFTLAQIETFGVVLFGVSLLLYPTGAVGVVYLAGAVVLGGWLLAAGHKLGGDGGEAMRFFGLSNVYLASMFALMALDVVIVEAGDGGRFSPEWLQRPVLVVASVVIAAGLIVTAGRELSAPDRSNVNRVRAAFEVLLPVAATAFLVAWLWTG